jgi:ubiquinone/menaquinone biosynthesis C-methylase UbiE
MAASSGLFSSNIAEVYERFLVGPLFSPFAQQLLDRAALAPTERLLDIACGTGVVARTAQQVHGHRGQAVGVDASPAMLGMARTVAPTIEFREGDASRLPVGNTEQFDLVSCHQGLQFFPDKPAAIREMRRVLAPGGRIALGTWLSVPDVPLIRDLHRVGERHLGPFVDQRHSLGDVDAIRRLLAEVGLRTIEVETVTRTIRMPDGAIFARLNTMAIVGMSPAAKAMSEEERAQAIAVIANDSLDAIQGYLDGTELVFDLGSNVAIARA